MHRAHRLLSESTLILCTLRNRPGGRPEAAKSVIALHRVRSCASDFSGEGKGSLCDCFELCRDINLKVNIIRNESHEDSATLPGPEIIAAEIDSKTPVYSPFGLSVHVGRSHELHCRRPPSRAEPVHRNRIRFEALDRPRQ